MHKIEWVADDAGYVARMPDGVVLAVVPDKRAGFLHNKPARGAKWCVDAVRLALNGLEWLDAGERDRTRYPSALLARQAAERAYRVARAD